MNLHIGQVVFDQAKEAFGEANVRRDNYTQKDSLIDFPVLCNNGRIISSFLLSETLQRLPVASFDYIFIKPDLLKEGQAWCDKNIQKMLSMVAREE